ncbi:hypothetical protein DYH09_02805 [bacterium CPR1]|nr:hypothetical protein [bacterium CPR1]
MAVNPMVPGFDPGKAGRPVASNGNPTVTSSEPEDRVGAPVDPYERMTQMRKQGLGSTAMGPIVADQVPFGQAPPPQAAPEQPGAPPAPEPPAVQTQPDRPIVVKEPVSEDMREMIANMRRAGVEIPEAPEPSAPPAAAPAVGQAGSASPPPPTPVPSEQAPEISAQPQVPQQSVSQDPWARLEEMRRNGMGSTPVSGFASQQLGLQGPGASPTPAPQPTSPYPEPPAQSPAPSPPPEPSAQSPVPSSSEPSTQSQAEARAPEAGSLQGAREVPRPLKEPITGDMAQMLEDMRANGALPPSEPVGQAAASGSPVQTDPVPTPPSEQPAPPPSQDSYARMEQMRQRGLGSTQAGSLARAQIDLEEFDRQHPAPPPPQEFEIAPPPRTQESVIAPGGQNRVFDEFQVPAPPPRSDWWGSWGDFGKAPQPPPQTAPQAPPASTQPGDGWFGQWGDFGAAPAQTTPAATPAPASQPSNSWFGQWGDFGAAPAQTAAAPAPQQPAANQWWGRWGDFTPSPAPTPPVQPQSCADDWLQMGRFQPDYRSPQQPYYDPQQASYDPYQAYSGIQMPYQPHPGSLPPSMQSYGQYQQQAPWQMQQQMQMPPMSNAPLWSIMSLMPAISMISMLPMMMMPMMMMPMMMPFAFGGFGF